MKVSLNLVRTFTDIKVQEEKLLERIGGQLGAIDEVIDWGARYKGVVIAKVISCEKHPNADKLSVCLIDDGGAVKNVKRFPWPQGLRSDAVSVLERAADGAVRGSTAREQRSSKAENAPKTGSAAGSASRQADRSHGLVQVVCGAPNVAASQLVVWLPPGASVPSLHDSEPLELESREIRGVMSNGMLGSGAELAVNGDQNGIVVIREEDFEGASSVKPGTLLADLLDLDDTIIDIENKMFTHRPDCFGILGVAREIAGITGHKFQSPAWYLRPGQLPSSRSHLPLTVRNDAPELVPRFMAVALDNVKVKPSPLWLQSYLMRVGIRPVNNIVDITNYVAYVTAQPLHAYDYDKLLKLDGSTTATLNARTSKPGEKVRLIDGKEHAVEPETIVISTKKALVGLGGVMGGENSEVDGDTKRIVLECANFNMYSIRRTSMEHGIFSDAVTRFNKGQSPHMNDKVLSYATALMTEFAGGDVASKIFDEKSRLPALKGVKLTGDFVNERLGLSLSAKEMKTLLENVEFEVGIHGQHLRVLAPEWRTDIHIPEDVVEEIGRLYGYDRLPMRLPARDLRATDMDDLLSLKHNMREKLAKAGANEVLTYSFIHGDFMKKVGQDPAHAYRITNALSPELQYYRLSLTPSLLDKVHMNIRAGFDEFVLFEIGKAHIKGNMDKTDKNLPAEEERLSLVYANKPTAKYAPYYMARKYIGYLLDSLGVAWDIDSTERKPRQIVDQQALAPFDENRTGYIKIRMPDGKYEQAGFVGEPKVSVASALKLPAQTAAAEIDIKKLLQAVSTKPTYIPLPDYPKVTQDITYRITVDTRVSEIQAFVLDNLQTLAGNSRWSLCIKDIYQPAKGKAAKHITFSFEIASYEKTLTTKEVNQLLEELSLSVANKYKAKRI